MYEFHPYFTNDGSVGLYNSDYDDIYHSAKGALTEAYEKFILPVDYEKLLKKDQIKVLDICYGIGYNTKTFLNFILNNFELRNKKNFISKIHNIETIYTDKKSDDFYINNDTIYGDNIFSKISVTAVDNDKILGYLSPFITTCYKKLRNDNLNFKYKNLEKYIFNNKNEKIKNFPKINKIINFAIFNKILSQYPDFLNNKTLISILKNIEYDQFFDPDIRAIYESYSDIPYSKSSLLNKFAFLHNIYYNHISNKYKKDLKRYNLDNITLRLLFEDARVFIKNDNNKYNLIFLDAFTPSKCPCLWSFEFFKELFDHLEDDGQILTYSTSAAIRGAMTEAGFYIGNIFSHTENRNIGTIATKLKANIKSQLSEYDLGLIKTRAGIFYRDKNLTGQNEAIKAARDLEVKNSTRISSTKYNSQYKQ
jgi:tRNA U34 5-methylaminomethyl-2-thiouridine-forming methyltransferase MnmC